METSSSNSPSTISSRSSSESPKKKEIKGKKELKGNKEKKEKEKKEKENKGKEIKGKKKENKVKEIKTMDEKEYCRLLTLRELKIIAKQYNIKITQKKPQLIENIMNIYRTEKEKGNIESPQSIIENKKTKTRIEEDKEKEKARKIKNKEIEDIKKKDFTNVIQNKDLGFFNGLPKDCFQHLLSFLNEYEVVKFSITNKLMRKLCLNPIVTKKTMHSINQIRKNHLFFVPNKLGSFLKLPEKLIVNKYYVITRKLFYYLFVDFFKSYIELKKPSFNPGVNCNTKVTIKRMENNITFNNVYIKEGFFQKIDMNKLSINHQQALNDAYVKQTPISFNRFTGYIFDLFLTRSINIMEWDIDLDLAFWFHEQELKYKSLIPNS